MADSGAAQNKLGELFVDIGVGGLGKTIKALNTVSASFLLTKNAAVQMARPVVNFAKSTLNMAVDVGKLGSTLGVAYKDAYKLQYYFKRMNLSEGLINDIQRISELFSLISQGQASLSASQMTGFANLGMSWEKYYGGGFKKSQEFFKDLQKATANMDRTKAATSLEQIGLSTEWLYTFDRGIFDLSDALEISDEKIEAAITAQEDLNEATLALQNALQELVITITPYVSQYAPIIADKIKTYAPKLIAGVEKLYGILEQIVGFFTKESPTIDPPDFNEQNNKIKSAAIGIATGVGALTGGPLGAVLAGGGTAAVLSIADAKANAGLNNNYHPFDDKNLNPEVLKHQMAQQAAMRAEVNAMLYGKKSPEIKIMNYITGQNADEIARKTSVTTKDVLQDMLNKYQVTNMVGK